MDIDFDEMMKPPQAAKYMKKSVSQLAKWRLVNYGPRYVRIGRSILYRKCDIKVFIDGHIVETENLNA